MAVIRAKRGRLLQTLLALGVLTVGVCQAATPSRIVSLDYCADQFVLKLVEPSSIAALSIDATSPFSYMRDAAAGHRKVRASAEEVLALAPDTIVRSYGGGPNASSFYEQLGITVIQVGFANTIEEVRQVLRHVAGELGAGDAATAIIADMNQRLQRLPPISPAPSTLYVTPGGVTSGPGSLVHQMLLAAGLANYQQRPGWRSLPLEQLAFDQPEMLATAFYDTNARDTTYWSAARHPVIRQQLAHTRNVTLDAATTSCGGWFVIDAIEQLARGTAP